MFRLKIPRTQFNFGFKICRNYLSHEYKNTLVDFNVHALETSNAQTKGHTAQGVILVDIVNGIAHDNRDNGFSESLLKLRSVPDKAAQFDATNYAIFRNFLDHENIDELLSLIKNRLQSGIFIDNFLGCYILNQLLQENNFIGATEVSLEIFKQDSLDNKLVSGLILKSIFEYLKLNIDQIIPPVVKEKKSSKKSDEKKIRVKFIRNESTNQQAEEIGKALCRISELYPDELTENLKLLGALLDNRNNLATSLVNNKEIVFCKQTLELCKSLLKNKEVVDENLTNGINLRLEGAVDTKNIDALLSVFLEAGKKDETKLIEQQKAKYELWKEQDILEKSKQINITPPSERKENIEQILADINQKRQKLWYFENEELIDLEIFKKNKSYPKRWFGKKKKPKVVDDNYVPPEITRKS
ncbi:PREDICTED: uncharacterized protein LOC108968850 [Bactrocera latifrons]|uniref:uncharacterized protein LOC108968850 n=1 Tax=Bactrocera latifrons TaxID=174628 RepID=UPI0008DDB6F2|nr:PREDICTED: uncharacterized protein LOC108968850 [Bactrocera latifrons]